MSKKKAKKVTENVEKDVVLNDVAVVEEVKTEEAPKEVKKEVAKPAKTESPKTIVVTNNTDRNLKLPDGTDLNANAAVGGVNAKKCLGNASFNGWVKGNVISYKEA